MAEIVPESLARNDARREEGEPTSSKAPFVAKKNLHLEAMTSRSAIGRCLPTSIVRT